MTIFFCAILNTEELNMDNSIYKNRWLQIVASTLFLVAGILIMVYGIIDQGSVTKVISIVLAVSCFITGALSLVTSFFVEPTKVMSTGLVVGSMSIALGVLLCCRTEVFGSIVVYFVGALALAVGGVALIKGVIMLVKKTPASTVVLFFIVAAIAITLGVLTFCYLNGAQQVIYVATGTVIALAGLAGLVLNIKHLVDNKKEKKSK